MSDPFLPEHGRMLEPDAAVRDETTPRPSNRDTAPASAAPAPLPPVAAERHFVPVTRALLAATLAVAVLVSAVVWLDGRRTQQLLRAEVAHRLDQIDMAGQTAAKSQQQMASDLRDAQAKITLLEARIAESQEQQA